MKAFVIDFSNVLIFPKVPTTDLSQSNFSLNDELLSYLKSLRSWVPVYLFTNGALHAVPEIAVSLKGVFAATYTAEGLGVSKSRSEAYEVLARKIGVIPQEIVFVDDQLTNVKAAQQAGVQAMRYISNNALMTKLNKLIL